jgi:hypothetical protein
MIKTSKYKTDFLFPKSSFFIGIGSAFNIFGNYYKFNTSKTPLEADFKAIQSDWGVVGQDIEKSIKIIKKEITLK